MSTEDRRVYLVNKLIDEGLDPDEDVELDALQMAKGRDRIPIHDSCGNVFADMGMEDADELLEEANQMPESYVRQMLAAERGENIDDVIEVEPRRYSGRWSRPWFKARQAVKKFSEDME